MAVTKVVVKNSEIDGKPISWNVLAITGYVGGDYQTLELKLNKTEAMLASLLLNSDEEVPKPNARKATEEEKEKFDEENKQDDSKGFWD